MGQGEWMSVKEVNRYEIIRKVLERQLTQADAARQLKLSVRQVRRLSARVRDQGAQGLISRKRGKASSRRIDCAEQARIVALVRSQYADFGPQLATEYLRRNHSFQASVETLRKWMIGAGIWQARARKVARIHSPRDRRPRKGELVQIDGSHHDWFEGRADKCCLLAFIDDATGQVLAARFQSTETTQGYLGLLGTCIEQHGRPLALYSDRHSIFTKHDEHNPKPTQFERALLQLDIEGICAHTPQAKGRVERLFQTLQDRMCKAMRLEGISSMEAANAWLTGYLSEHNKRFAVKAKDQRDAHRSNPYSRQELGRICSEHHQRKLSGQLSCQFEGDIIQVLPQSANAPKGAAQIDIAKYADGSLEVLWRGQVLEHRRFTVNEHLKKPKCVDAKGLDGRINSLAHKEAGAAVRAEQRRLGKIFAQIEHQDWQRSQGHYKLAHANAPRSEGSASRNWPRPAHSASPATL